MSSYLFPLWMSTVIYLRISCFFLINEKDDEEIRCTSKYNDGIGVDPFDFLQVSEASIHR